MADLKVIKKYGWGEAEELLEKTILYCPSCGEQNVYIEKSEGDYYQGPSHYCTSCRVEFTMPSYRDMNDDIYFKDL